MFAKIINWIRRLLKTSTTDGAVSQDVIISPKMENSIALWDKMYRNESPWADGKKVVSLNLASAIAAEFATLVTLEFKSSLSGSPRADFLNTVYQYVIDHIHREVEFAGAYGSKVFKPYVSGDKICIDFINADCFLPLAFDSSGRMTAVIFYSQISRDNKIFTRLEKHELIGTDYTITNKAFVSSTIANLGREIELSSVPEWQDLASSFVIKNVEKPLFGLMKVALANNVDTTSPLGVSIFSRAVELIREADKQFSRLKWEFEGGELAVDAAADCLKPIGNTDCSDALPEHSDRLFRKISNSDPDFYKVFSPALRDNSLVNGLNKIFQRIEFNCGFAYGTISDPQNVDKTAEEIKTSKQRSYAMVTLNQKALENALTDLAYAMDVYATLYNLAPAGEYEQTFDFSDSVLTDANKEQAIRLAEVTAGIVKGENYLAWRYGITEDEAKGMMPQKVNMSDPFGFNEE